MVCLMLVFFGFVLGFFFNKKGKKKAPVQSRRRSHGMMVCK